MHCFLLLLRVEVLSSWSSRCDEFWDSFCFPFGHSGRKRLGQARTLIFEVVFAKAPRAQGQRTCLGMRVLSGRGTLARPSSSQQSRVPSRRHSGLTRTVVVLQSWCTAEQPGLVLAGMPLICCARFVKEPDRMWAHLSNGRNGTRCLVLHAGGGRQLFAACSNAH